MLEKKRNVWLDCFLRQSLYDNEQQIQDQFAKFWAEVADYFSSNPYVFGYELLNEPWAGDVYGHPDHLLSRMSILNQVACETESSLELL